MIAYAIEAAKESRLFSRIIVSTEDPEVSEISQRYGAEVPFLRPAELADDHTPTVPVIAHAIQELEANGNSHNFVCCIYPCVPFLKCKDLKNALSLLKKRDADYSFPVVEYLSPIQRALKIKEDDKVIPFKPDFELSRTQDLESAYHDAGQFYWGKKSAWQTGKQIHSNAAGYIIPRNSTIDIDNTDDWTLAESLIKILNQKK